MKTFLKTLILSIFVITVSCNEDVIYHTAANAEFSASKDTIELGEIVSFTDISTPAHGSEITLWEWDFGEDSLSVSTEQNPTYTYQHIGNFKVKLTITDSNGRTAFFSKMILVTTPYSALAHAEFSISTTKATLYTPVQFTDLSVPADGATITSWLWNFGNNETAVSTLQHPTYSYNSSGNFTVSLTVTDSKNNTSTISHDLAVVDPSELINISWKKAMLGAIENTVSPAMSPDGKTVYMWADQSGTDKYDVVLKAFDSETGTERWAFNVNLALAGLNPGGGVRLVYASPSVGNNGDIYIAARDLKNTGAARKTFLFAVKSDGQQRWAYNFSLDGNINYQTPAIDASGKIYVGHLTTAPFEIAVLDPQTGTKIKSIPTSLGICSGISLDKTGNVYFCSTGTNGLFSYTPNSTLGWQYNTGFVTTGGDITIDSDGTVYTVAEGTTGGMVVAINPSGTKKWDYRLKGVTQFGGVVLGTEGTIYASGGKVVTGQQSAGIVALNADGSLKWHYTTDEDVNNCVPLVDNRGYVHFITDKGTYYVITDNGLLYGKKSIGSKSFSSPVMNTEGKVFIAAEDENNISFMYCLDTDASGIANSAWPMKGQNSQRTHLQK